MNNTNQKLAILVADDDEEDCLIVQNAVRECRISNPLFFVKNGEETLDFLKNRGQYADADQFPMPGLLLLDLNMPKMNGWEVLEALQKDPDLSSLPVAILSTSESAADIERAYRLGASSYITKPLKFVDFVDLMKTLNHYWFEIVSLPNHRNHETN